LREPAAPAEELASVLSNHSERHRGAGSHSWLRALSISRLWAVHPVMSTSKGTSTNQSSLIRLGHPDLSSPRRRRSSTWSVRVFAARQNRQPSAREYVI
jgi:hypothetical protein